jgi:hypothetical protein
MKIFKELNKLGYIHYSATTIEELDDLPLDSEERIIEQTLVLRWFRKKKYQAEILWRGDFGDFCWKIGRFKYGSHFFSDDGFKTYEQAEFECLRKLIELANEKKIHR